MLGVGIGTYFSLRVEPAFWMLCACVAFGLLVVAHRRFAFGAVAGLLLTGMCLTSLGFGIAGLRAHAVSGPVIKYRHYGAIEGRVVAIDRSASDAVRLTLDRVVLERTDPKDVPKRVRVSLHGGPNVQPTPGMIAILTGHLGPPGGAVEPGGFDFRRHAWFLRLGAVGYTRSPVLLLDEPSGGLLVFRARRALSSYVTQKLPGETGAFAAAIMSGDRSDVGQATLQALRDSNLAHLLAISGLHMGLLSGFVFAALRLLLLTVPTVRHHWPVKKLAAGGALIVAAGYLALSGGNIATERAFIMVAVALTAIMVNRRAISLRTVAIAALMVLLLRPEALLSPGFQMSFAATVALVAVFEGLSRRNALGSLPKVLSGVLSLVVSSAVAGAATAPVGMAHFNQASVYGLLANLVSVPVMGLLVVPVGVCAVLLMPFGVDVLALTVMGWGLDWILAVAKAVASWPGATRAVMAPPPTVLAVIACGGLILCLWRGVGRVAGVLPIGIGCAFWAMADRPEVLIADNGTLVGIMTEQGRAISRSKGASFIAQNWLENDGHGLTQGDAAELWPGIREGSIVRARIGTHEVVHLQGQRAVDGFGPCQPHQIIVASVDYPSDEECTVYDIGGLSRTGAVALAFQDGNVVVTTASQTSGHRLWSLAP
ncbi:ComEC/Rec2 family competence protein [Sagittula sp. SSi028]|uniref:ComEC/Rec2 family competence protein n=1 Tax=Sagittula sp. SSi028 TaxID=3400636 RepID=UPI003AF597EB